MLYLTSVTVKGFDIHGFGWAILSAIVLSAVSFLISYLVEDKNFNLR
jgi:putative membrane protein